jgi:hypothetical protein
MSVLACDRNGCNSIMCDRYSSKHGYICDRCFVELTQKYPETSIEDFMESEFTTGYDNREHYEELCEEFKMEDY